MHDIIGADKKNCIKCFVIALDEILQFCEFPFVFSFSSFVFLTQSPSLLILNFATIICYVYASCAERVGMFA